MPNAISPRALAASLLTVVLLTSAMGPSLSAQEAASTAELPIYTALRSAKLSGEVANVANLKLKRDAGIFTFKSGEIYFVTPVEGRVTGAVFVGDGEFTLTPPNDAEKKALAIYVSAPTVTEPFTEMVLRFSDETWEELKEAGATFSTGGAQADRAAKILDDNDKLLRRTLRQNHALRAFTDLYSKEKARYGYFAAFIKGKKYEKLLFQLDPRGIPFVAPEQVMLASFDNATGGIWTAFEMEDANARNASLYDISMHEIEASIDGTMMTASDRLTLKVLREGTRVLPFELFPTLRVSKVWDGSGNELQFVQQKQDEDADFAVVFPSEIPAGTDITLRVEYAGKDAVRDSGGGNFILIPRSTWYPNNGSTAFGDRAKFRTTFRIPKKMTIVGTGSLVEDEKEEGNQTVSKWTSGDLELAVTGFNYGQFKKKDLHDKDTGYTIEFYANKRVPDEIRELQIQIEQAESQGAFTGTTLQSISTTGMANTAITDAQNATRIYTLYFGKLPYTRVAMTQQPAINFGQAWPTLIYMPYTAFLDTNTRRQILGTRFGTNDFWRYVGPHEVAHQWWGHIIGWTSYRDQWMSEGFAEFSTSLYVQQVYGMDKFGEFWEDHREQIVKAGPATEGKAPYTIGPVTQGFRLSGAKTGAVYQFLVYPKGAYILHMLRMLMYDPQTSDNDFSAMMKDFVQSYYNNDVSTEDFKRVVERHMKPGMDLDGNGRMDWFFDQWIYGTDMPSYNFEYSFQKSGNQTVLVGKLTQSGVHENFKMQVPLYLDFGKGWVRLGQVKLTGTTTEQFQVPLPQQPKRAAANALNDVLCLENTNVGK